MPCIEDENGNHVTDENGNKIEYTVNYEEIGYVCIHKEPIHVNSDGQLDTEDRNLKVKDATDGSHAVSKNQLDNLSTQITTMINNLKSEITTMIQTSMKTHEAKIITQMINFRNEQIKNRIPQTISIGEGENVPSKPKNDNIPSMSNN